MNKTIDTHTYICIFCCVSFFVVARFNSDFTLLVHVFPLYLSQCVISHLKKKFFKGTLKGVKTVMTETFDEGEKLYSLFI